MSVLLEWSPMMIGDSQRVYRSTAIFDADSLPSILATIAADDTRYEDSISIPITYFYAIEAVSGIRTALSSVEEIAHVGAIAADKTFDLAIASGKVGSDLSNYPVVVDMSLITDASWWADVARTDGGDIRVFDDSDVALPFDMIDIDTTAKTGICVVRSDVSSGGTTIRFVAYNDISVTLLGASDTNGQHDTWQDFEAVYLLRGDLTDRTSNARDLTARTGSPTYATTFEYGLGGGVDTTSAAFDATNVDAALASSFGTLMVGCSMQTDTSSNQFAFSTLTTASLNTDRSGIGEEQSISKWASFSTSAGFLASAIAANSGDKAMLHTSVQSGGNSIFSVDGVFIGNVSTGTRFQRTTMLGSIEGTSDSSWRGDIGMAYRRSDIVSADWIAADFENFDLSKTLFR